jgi:hypothetical protein
MSWITTPQGRIWEAAMTLDELVTHLYGQGAYLHTTPEGRTVVYGPARVDAGAWTVLAEVTGYGDGVPV